MFTHIRRVIVASGVRGRMMRILPGSGFAVPSLAVVGLTSVVLACSDGPEAPTQPPEMAANNAASSALAGTGGSMGTVSIARSPHPDGRREISRNKARRLAEFWVEDHDRINKKHYEERRGGAIAWEDLKACGRTLHVSSPVEDLEAAPRSAQRTVGPWWLVNLCATGEPQINVAVSALSTEVTIEDGRLEAPDRSNLLMPLAIPQTTSRQNILLTAPEAALGQARKRLSGPVKREVEFVSIPGVYPQFARWRITTESPVTVKVQGSSEPVTSKIFYYGFVRGKKDGQLSVPSDDGPQEVTVGFFERTEGKSLGNAQTKRVPVRNGMHVEVRAIGQEVGGE